LKNISNNFQKGVDKTPFLCYNIDTKEREVNKMKLTRNDYRLYNEAKVGEWVDCLFVIDEGEEVLVELKKEENETAEMFVVRCEMELEENGLEIEEFEGFIDAEVAEMMGLDTY
jgi:hypothetical protein